MEILTQLYEESTCVSGTTNIRILAVSTELFALCLIDGESIHQSYRACHELIEAETNGRVVPDDIFKCILNGNAWISIKISLNLAAEGPNNNNPVLVQLMAWCQPGDKPLSEPMMVRLPTHICVTRPR